MKLTLDDLEKHFTKNGNETFYMMGVTSLDYKNELRHCVYIDLHGLTDNEILNLLDSKIIHGRSIGLYELSDNPARYRGSF